jgi:SAM-dependent methyltransferase
MYCRMCRSADLVEFLDLGHHPPSNGFLPPEALKEPETFYPLNVLLCTSCGLSQLGYVVPKRILFGPDYPYDSSTSRTFREHFAGMAADVAMELELQRDTLAVDIGSNTGVLLSGFKAQGLRVVGVEPADNMADKANDQGIETLNTFFSPQAVQDIVSAHGKASVVTATNVFAHIDDLAEVAGGVRDLLQPGGVFVVEAQYFLDMVTHLEYDQIYHEHYSYMTLRPMVAFFQRHGMEVFYVHHAPTHGGSLRVFVGFSGEHRLTPSVAEFCKREEESGVHALERLLAFAKAVREGRDKLVQQLVALKAGGKRIVGIGAPAKGNTLLNYCKISTHLLEQLTEKAPAKIGLFSPGMHIPVVAESRLTEDPPDYGLILAWNLKDEIMENLSEYSRLGGRYIIPVPSVSIV